jgi:hypothetical protein
MTKFPYSRTWQDRYKRYVRRAQARSDEQILSLESFKEITQAAFKQHHAERIERQSAERLQQTNVVKLKRKSRPIAYTHPRDRAAINAIKTWTTKKPGSPPDDPGK